MTVRMLDVYCCAGGATRGYQQAGAHVTGVDRDEQPNYIGDDFVQADAVEFIARHGHKFDVIHTSPPCQAACAMTKGTNKGKRVHPDLIPATRAALLSTGRPFIIENVSGAVIRKDLTLCGEMFGLGVIRHRHFELHGLAVPQPVHVAHRGKVTGYRHGAYYTGPYYAVYGHAGGKGTVAQWQTAMGIDWTSQRRELSEAIPPAYTRHIGMAVL